MRFIIVILALYCFSNTFALASNQQHNRYFGFKVNFEEYDAPIDSDDYKRIQSFIPMDIYSIQAFTGRWSLVKFDPPTGLVTINKQAPVIEFHDCGDRICAYMVKGKRCSNNIMLPYDKPLPLSGERAYIMYTPQMFKEPHFIYLGRDRGETKQGHQVDLIHLEGASFSFYQKTGNFVYEERDTMQYQSYWRYIGLPTCPEGAEGKNPEPKSFFGFAANLPDYKAHIGMKAYYQDMQKIHRYINDDAGLFGRGKIHLYIGRWERIATNDQIDNKTIDHQPEVIEIQNCAYVACGYRIVDGQCQAKSLTRYPKPLPQFIARGYVFYLPEMKEPHFTYLTIDPQNAQYDQADRQLVMKDASFSYYHQHINFLHDDHKTFQYQSRWKYLGPPSCPKLQQ